jgi:hypothetical protein
LNRPAIYPWPLAKVAQFARAHGCVGTRRMACRQRSERKPSSVDKLARDQERRCEPSYISEMRITYCLTKTARKPNPRHDVVPCRPAKGITYMDLLDRASFFKYG